MSRAALQPAPGATLRKWVHVVVLNILILISIVLLLSTLHPIFVKPYLSYRSTRLKRQDVSQQPLRLTVHDLDIAKNNPSTSPLLSNWCPLQDKAATVGWNSISDIECMNRITNSKTIAAANVAKNKTGLLLFKHQHKASGTTLCRLAQNNNHTTEDVPLPWRDDWTTNCVPYESFLGPYPAVGGKKLLQRIWPGGACFLSFLTTTQLHALEHHYQPLNFIASEGPMPDAWPLDKLDSVALMTMFRHPLDRILSSYKWWKFMNIAMPYSPSECHAYTVPNPNATFSEWLHYYPDNWITREFIGANAIYLRGRTELPVLNDMDLEAAKKRLHLFAAVLVMERWEGSMKLMQRLFDWQNIDYTTHRAGSTENTSAKNELSDKVFKELERQNHYDIELYKYALSLHEHQLAQML